MRSGRGKCDWVARRFCVRPQLEILEHRTVPSAFLVKDINTNTAGSNPSNMVNVSGTLFFSATDSSGNVGLWRSNGTAAGTALVREFTAGLGNLVNVNGSLDFEVSNNQVTQLWQSDGTTSGTIVVHDFGGPNYLAPGAVSFHSKLYFVVGGHLWASNGTDRGTVPVDPGAFANVNDLTPFSGRLYFAADDPINGAKLWQTAGADANTRIADADVIAKGVGGLINGVDNLYFFADTDPTGQTTNLYSSNGTKTTLVAGGFSGFGGGQLVFSGGKLFFTASPANSFSVGLWVFDPSTASVSELTPTAGLFPSGLQAVNGRVVFNGGFSPTSIWTSDGTNARTFPLPTPQAIYIPLFGGTALSGTTLYFGAAGTNGAQLWQTDGTSAGTRLVTPIAPGFVNSLSSTPSDLTFAGTTLYFAAADGPHGDELWASDGTAVGTRLVKDINTDTIGSFPSLLTNANGTLYFAANGGPLSPLGDQEAIWKSDGTSAGTMPVVPFDFSSPLVSVNGMVFFAAGFDSQLWVTNGTGALELLDTGAPATGDLGNFTAVGDHLYFTINDPDTGLEDLWTSDGTVAGTQMVEANLLVVADTAVAVGNTLFFVSVDLNTFAFQLWSSDGTAAGTHIVDPTNPGTSSLDLFSAPTNVNGTLYFFDQTPNFDDETLWTTDGTTATLVAHLAPGDAFPYDMTAVNGTLYFAASDFSTGISQLWVSNGTAAGTGPVATVQPDFGPGNSVAVGDRLFFTANDPVQGEQLWVSDGTVAGTHPVTNIVAGPRPPFEPLTFNLTAFNNRAFFTASDPAHGEELWSSDGTAAGKSMVQDINPGNASSNPSALTVVGNTLYFAATDLLHGTELWAYRPGVSVQFAAQLRQTASGNDVPIGDLLAGPPGADNLSGSVGNLDEFFAHGSGVLKNQRDGEFPIAIL
jgi:ELWxxDGT repeat protein